MTINISWMGVFKLVWVALLVFIIFQQQTQIINLNNGMMALNANMQAQDYIEREEIAQIFGEHNKRQAQVNLMLGIYIQKILSIIDSEGEDSVEVPETPEPEPKNDHQKRNENLQRQLHGNPEYQV